MHLHYSLSSSLKSRLPCIATSHDDAGGAAFRSAVGGGGWSAVHCTLKRSFRKKKTAEMFKDEERTTIGGKMANFKFE
jgi:hypothetical protein